MAGKSPEEEHPVKAFGYAARDPSGFLSPFTFSSRKTGDDDVRFKVLYCGICHTDLHFIRNEFGSTPYPVVPGHEIVGIVTEIGSKVTKLKVGDKVGVGFVVGSCGSCENCETDLENYCPKFIQTFAAPYKDGSITYGGFSSEMVVNERFAIHFPNNLPLEGGAPLLCAGITVYSPMKFYGLDKPGMRIGVVGLGGIGHVAVKFAKAFGAKVTVISTSLKKKDEAINKFGADSFLVSRDSAEMQSGASSLDGILDCVSADHDIMALVNLLKPHGKLVLLGAIAEPIQLQVFPLIVGRKVIGGSNTGGMKETQEMIDFAAKHNVVAEVEVVPMEYVNTAMERLEKGDVRYRFVLDVGNAFVSS